MLTVLEQVDALPGSQAELTVINGDRKGCVGEHGAHVRGGIVFTFGCMAKPGLTFRDQALHEALQVDAGRGVVILADDQ